MADAQPDPEDRDPIVVVDYDPEWPAIAGRVCAEIRKACGELVLAIEHVGSTSVPGLAAKPIIDLVPLLARFEDGFACVATMETLGYQARGEYGLAGRHYFVRYGSGDDPTVHAHMFTRDSAEARRLVLFRDYLRAHPAEAEEYARTKRLLAVRHRREREAYTEAKTPFIRGAEARAQAWHAAGRPTG